MPRDEQRGITLRAPRPRRLLPARQLPDCPERRFDENHLQCIGAVAGMAAVAWENASYLEWLEGVNDQLLEELKPKHDMVGMDGMKVSTSIASSMTRGSPFGRRLALGAVQHPDSSIVATAMRDAFCPCHEK